MTAPKNSQDAQAIVVDPQLRSDLLRVLTHVRNAMIAQRADASPLPPLLAAEEQLLHVLFNTAEVEEYLASTGAKVYGR
jgi:hypothetical protein